MKKDRDRHLCPACLESEYETYRHARVHELMELNKHWLEQFKIDYWPRWDYDLDSSTLVFSQNGQRKVIADIEVVGTVHGTSWEWAWGNLNLPEPCRARIGAVREFGEEKQWAKLTTLFLESDDFLGWELTSIAAHILGAKGAYRCPDSERPSDF